MVALRRKVFADTGLKISVAFKVFSGSEDAYEALAYLCLTRGEISGAEGEVVTWKSPRELATSGRSPGYNSQLFKSLRKIS